MNNLEDHRILLGTFRDYIESCIEHSDTDRLIVPMSFDDWKKLVWPELKNNIYNYSHSEV